MTTINPVKQAKRDKVYRWLWIGWVASFFAIEGTAIATRDWPGTLSDNVRALFRTKTKAGRLAWACIGGTFFGWFMTHISVEGSE